MTSIRLFCILKGNPYCKQNGVNGSNVGTGVLLLLCTCFFSEFRFHHLLFFNKRFSYLNNEKILREIQFQKSFWAKIKIKIVPSLF